MTTGTLTLTGFLLARIADGMADVQFRRERLAEIERIEGEDYAARFDNREDIDFAEREVEAKRRIMEACTEERRAYGLKSWREPVTRRSLYVLACLALPHAGHPDYRQEWKP